MKQTDKERALFEAVMAITKEMASDPEASAPEISETMESDTVVSASGCGFPVIDKDTDTYFEDAGMGVSAAEDMDIRADAEGAGGKAIFYCYGFRNIPELKKLLRERLGDDYSDEQILEIAKTVFRNKPDEADAYSEKGGADAQPVDFIYQF